MKVVNVHEAKTTLSKLLQRAARGERIVIAKSGVPLAELGPLQVHGHQPRFDGAKGRVRMRDDFNAPMTEEELAAFGA